MTKTHGAKTLAVLVLMTAILTIFSACGGDGGSGGSGDLDVVGKWDLATIEMEGISMDIDAYFSSMGVTEADLAAMGISIDMYVEFTEDGDMTFDFMGETMTGTYTVSGSNVRMTMDGETITCPVENDVLTMEDDDEGIKMTFNRA